MSTRTTMEWRKTLSTGDLVSVRNKYLRSPNAVIEGIYHQDYQGERQWIVRLCAQGRTIIVLERNILEPL